MESRWPDIADEAIVISDFNTEFGWIQEDTIEWQYPLVKDGVHTKRSEKCPVTMNLLSKNVRNAGFSLLDYGHMVRPRSTIGRRFHLCLSGGDYVYKTTTQTHEEVDGGYFIQGTKVIKERDGVSYVFSGELPWGVVNMTNDSIIRLWCEFFPSN